MRKSPHKHTVRKHNRERGGVTVTSYTRGKGKQIPVRVIWRKKRQISDETSLGPKSFTVNFKYSSKKGDGESVVIFSDNYEHALDEAFEERKDQTRQPIEVELVDPSIGAALTFLRSGVKTVGGLAFRSIKAGAKVGAKYAVTVAKATPGIAKKVAIEAGKTALTGIQTRDARRLIKASFSRDKAERFFSRETLKRRYPGIYDKMSYSPPTSKSPIEKMVKKALREERKMVKKALREERMVEKALREERKEVAEQKKEEEEKKKIQEPAVKEPTIKKMPDYSKMSTSDLKREFQRTKMVDSVVRWKINEELEKRGEKPLISRWDSPPKEVF